MNINLFCNGPRKLLGGGETGCHQPRVPEQRLRMHICPDEHVRQHGDSLGTAAPIPKVALAALITGLSLRAVPHLK